MLNLFSQSIQIATNDLFFLDAIKKADFSNGHRLEHSLHYETAVLLAPIELRLSTDPQLLQDWIMQSHYFKVLTSKTHPAQELLMANRLLDRHYVLYSYPGLPCDKCYKSILTNKNITHLVSFEQNEEICGVNDQSIYKKTANKIVSDGIIQTTLYPSPYHQEKGIQMIDKFDRIYPHPH